MKLGIFLDTLDNDALIKIGADKGSSFLFIGTKREFIKSHEKQRKLYIKKLEHIITNTQSRINRLKKEHNIKDMLKAKKTLETNEQKLNGAKIPFTEREITQQFQAAPQIEPNPTLVIYIDGYEVGQLWMYSERQSETNGFGL